MAIEFIGTNSASVSGTMVRPTVTYPAGTQQGDLIVTVARSWNSELYDAWGADIRLVNSSRGGGNNLYILTETATGPSGSVMVEFNAGGNHHVTILVFRGVDPVNPVHAGMTSYDSTGTVHATPGLTTSIPDSVLVRAVATGLSGSSNSCSWAAPATERSDTRSSAGYSYISVATESRPTPGAAGAVNATYTATAYGIMATLALRPKSASRLNLGSTAVPLMLGNTEVEILGP